MKMRKFLSLFICALMILSSAVICAIPANAAASYTVTGNAIATTSAGGVAGGMSSAGVSYTSADATFNLASTSKLAYKNIYSNSNAAAAIKAAPHLVVEFATPGTAVTFGVQVKGSANDESKIAWSTYGRCTWTDAAGAHKVAYIDVSGLGYASATEYILYVKTTTPGAVVYVKNIYHYTTRAKAAAEHTFFNPGDYGVNTTMSVSKTTLDWSETGSMQITVQTSKTSQAHPYWIGIYPVGNVPGYDGCVCWFDLYSTSQQTFTLADLVTDKGTIGTGGMSSALDTSVIGGDRASSSLGTGKLYPGQYYIKFMADDNAGLYDDVCDPILITVTDNGTYTKKNSLIKNLAIDDWSYDKNTGIATFRNGWATASVTSGVKAVQWIYTVDGGNTIYNGGVANTFRGDINSTNGGGNMFPAPMVSFVADLNKIPGLTSGTKTLQIGLKFSNGQYAIHAWAQQVSFTSLNEFQDSIDVINGNLTGGGCGGTAEWTDNKGTVLDSNGKVTIEGWFATSTGVTKYVYSTDNGATWNDATYSISSRTDLTAASIPYSAGHSTAGFSVTTGDVRAAANTAGSIVLRIAAVNGNGATVPFYKLTVNGTLALTSYSVSLNDQFYLTASFNRKILSTDVVKVNGAAVNYVGSSSFRVATVEAKNIDKEYTVAITGSNSATLSVKGYCEAQIASSTASASLKNLCAAVLGFGAAAEKYFDGTTNMAQYLTNVTDFNASSYNKSRVAKSGATATFDGMFADLGATVKVVLKYTAPAGSRFYMNGTEMTTSNTNFYTDGNGGTYVELGMIAGNFATDLTWKITASDGTTVISDTITVSLFSYIKDYKAYAGAEADTVTLLNAVGNYGLLAAAYTA